MKLMQKLRSHRGETMVEMLVSMMILTLVICLLVTMIAVSYRFDRQARDADKKFKQDLATAENYLGTPTTGTVKLTDGLGNEQNPNVEFYSNTDSDLKSYKLKQP